METSFYIPNLTDAQMAQLDQLLINKEMPDWNNFDLSVEVLEFLKLIFETNNLRETNVSPGTFKPIPSKAPPPKFVKNGVNFIEIMNNWPVSNGYETMYDTNFYAYNVIVNSSNQVKLQVFYNLNGYVIDSLIVEDILFDAISINGTGLVQNLMVVVKLIPGNNPAQKYSEIIIPYNPTRISIVPKVNYQIANPPFNILSEVLSQKTFLLYKLS